MYRNYYSYNDMPTVSAKTEPKPVPCKPEAPPVAKPENNSSPGLLTRLAVDDIILLAIIFLLLSNGCEDKLLLLAIGFIFLTGIIF